ncbi:HlyD family secretion protein [Shewanella maritima]|uniref:HlyD family secretion protein n=1 Tax=Shewanella maritima TaxID=2520507 RepID=A0A411PKS8_9GAMM|nr:HlyD family secretion protein [Shewanella maritima]QBF84114.1 HlyD family secretion protein [Shewanella maritima]
MNNDNNKAADPKVTNPDTNSPDIKSSDTADLKESKKDNAKVADIHLHAVDTSTNLSSDGTNPNESTLNQASTSSNQGGSETRSSLNYKRWATSAAIVALGAVCLNVVGQRTVPISELGQVKGEVVAISPQVAGEVTEVLVSPNQKVSQGDVLARLNSTDFELALRQAEEQVTVAGKNIGELSKALRVAQNDVKQAQVVFEQARAELNTTLDKVANGEIPEAQSADIKQEFSVAESNLAAATERFLAAKQKFTDEGGSNNNVKSAMINLEQAQLNLERTQITAPADGYVTQLNIQNGAYVATGDKISHFLASDAVWVEVSFKENHLGNINSGDKVQFALDFAPGEVFDGEVAYVDYGVHVGVEAPNNTKLESSWLAEPQYFPVMVKVAPNVAEDVLKVGGQVDVIVYTQSQGS